MEKKKKPTRNDTSRKPKDVSMKRLGLIVKMRMLGMFTEEQIEKSDPEAYWFLKGGRLARAESERQASDETVEPPE